jgi:hypothetical protein
MRMNSGHECGTESEDSGAHTLVSKHRRKKGDAAQRDLNERVRCHSNMTINFRN